MNQLSLSNNWFRFKTSGKLPLHLQEFTAYSSIFHKEYTWKILTRKPMRVGNTRSRLIMPRILPGHVCCEVKFINLSLLLLHHHYPLTPCNYLRGLPGSSRSRPPRFYSPKNLPHLSPLTSPASPSNSHLALQNLRNIMGTENPHPHRRCVGPHPARPHEESPVWAAYDHTFLT
jgi:hypothetical protein